MKKVFAIALIATAMVACNNSSDKKEEVKDTTVVPVDTTTPPAVDTTTAPAADTTAAPVADTTKK